MLLEDDADLRRTLVRGLEEEGFAVAAFATGGTLIRAFPDAEPHVLILDIGVPDADGRDVCHAMRARGVRAPVLFLTARDALVDRLAGFSAGGDDYLTKPFAFAELVARLRALVRRGGGDALPTILGLRLDPTTHAASCGGVDITLTPTEFRLLVTLAASPGAAVRRRELVRAAWPHGAIVHDNTLDAYVARLRRKLRPIDAAPRIATVRAVGYRLQ